MASVMTATCGTVRSSRYLQCGKPLIQTYRTNQWSNKVCATPVSNVLFCCSSVRRWWPTSLCFYSWSSQWEAPPSAPTDRVLPVCLNILESPLKVLQVIWDACGGRVQLKCDGTRWRTGGEVKGKLANGVGSQYSSHYLGTWYIQHYYRWCAHLGCQESTELTPPPI